MKTKKLLIVMMVMVLAATLIPSGEAFCQPGDQGHGNQDGANPGHGGIPPGHGGDIPGNGGGNPGQGIVGANDALVLDRLPHILGRDLDPARKAIEDYLPSEESSSEETGDLRKDIAGDTPSNMINVKGYISAGAAKRHNGAIRLIAN
jgi:hypothetical protein